MTAELILRLLLLFTAAEFVFERILDALNISYRNQTIPANLQGIYDEAEYIKSQNYQKSKDQFGLTQTTLSFLVTLTALYFKWFGALLSFVQEYVPSNIYVETLGFFGLLFVINDLIGIPFSWYNTFVIEEKFGFNKTTVKLFWMDKIKSYGLVILIGAPIVSVLLFLIQWLGNDFWWIFWVIVGTLIVLLNLFYTSLLLPLFNKLTPLEDGELKTAIQQYCATQNFPLDNVYILDGSKRSNKANAFFSGIGKKKKIVLYDTLIQQQTTEEIVAVLAHEAGHYKKKHVIQMMFFAIFQMGAYLFVLSLMYNNTELSIAMGGTESHVALNLIAYGVLFTPISIVTGILMNIWSRKNEFEADAYAVTTYPGPYLANALKKLSKDNLSNLTPHPAYTFVHYSHPPMSVRLEAMEKR